MKITLKLRRKTLRHIIEVLILAVLVSLTLPSSIDAGAPALRAAMQGRAIAATIFSRFVPTLGTALSGSRVTDLPEGRQDIMDVIAKGQALAAQSDDPFEEKVKKLLEEVAEYRPPARVPEELQGLRNWIFGRVDDLREKQQQATDQIARLSDEERSTLAVKVYEGKGPDDPAKVPAWIRTVLRNDKIDKLRKKDDIDPWPSEDLENLLPALSSWPIETPMPPDVATEMKELLRCAEGVLKVPVFETFWKYEFAGLSYKAIALQLGIAEGTVSSRISNAHRQLREQC